MSNSITGNNARALVNNAFFWGKVLPGVRTNAAAWRVFTGYDEPIVPDPVKKSLAMPGIQDTSGFEIAVQFQFALPTFLKIGRGTSELELVAGDYVEDVEEYSWEMTHYVRTHFISDKDMKRVAGPYVKTDNISELAVTYLALGFAKQVNQELYADTDQTDTSIGSLEHIIDDSNVYGYNRSTSKYADLRSYVDTSTGELNWDKISMAQAYCRKYGGMTEAAISSIQTQRWIEYLARTGNVVHTTVDEKWAGYSGQYFRYGKTVFMEDEDCPDSVIYGISRDNPRGEPHWKVVRNEKPVVPGQFKQDWNRQGHPWVAPFDAYLAWACATPGAQFKLKAVTGPSGYSI